MSPGTTFTGGEAMTDYQTMRASEDQRLLKASLDLVAPAGDELIASFYDRLFRAHPEVRGMFPPVLDPQRDRLLNAIIALVTHYDCPQDLLPAFAALGRRHQRYGVRLEHYAAVGAVLIGTLAEYAGDAWNPRFHSAWIRAYAFAAGTMMQAGAIADEDDEEWLLAA
jgi:hemoglobin-like flavoprotein